MYTRESICAQMRESAQILIEDSVPSTNTSLRAMAENGAAEYTVLLSREQTAGRGRAGHDFFSPRDTGVYMSVLLRPTLPMHQALRITAAAAVAAAQAIESTAGVDAQIKWVNDIFCHDKKVCGILAEGVPGENDRFRFVILGIGINLSPPADGFPAALQDIAGAVCARDDLQSAWIAAFLDRFFAFCRDLSDEAILCDYRRRAYLQGKHIRVRGQRSLCGTVVGIDDDFRLLLQTQDGIVPLDSGEVEIAWRADKNV